MEAPPPTPTVALEALDTPPNLSAPYHAGLQVLTAAGHVQEEHDKEQADLIESVATTQAAHAEPMEAPSLEFHEDFPPDSIAHALHEPRGLLQVRKRGGKYQEIPKPKAIKSIKPINQIN